MAEMTVELVAVERRVWSGKASFVFARTTVGEIGILPGHEQTARAAGGGRGRPDRRDRRAVHHGGSARRVPARHARERHDIGGIGRDRRGGRCRARPRGSRSGRHRRGRRRGRCGPRAGPAQSRGRRVGVAHGGSGVRRRHPAAVGLSLPRIPRRTAGAPHAGRWCGCLPAKAGSEPPPRSPFPRRRGGMALRRRPLPGQRVRLVPADVTAARRHGRARPHGAPDRGTAQPRVRGGLRAAPGRVGAALPRRGARDRAGHDPRRADGVPVLAGVGAAGPRRLPRRLRR